MTLALPGLDGAVPAPLVLWPIRIAGGLAVLQFLLGSGVLRMVAGPDTHLRLAEFLCFAGRFVAPLFLFSFAVAVALLLLLWNSSRFMSWGLATLTLVTALAGVAALIDPLHGAIPIHSTFLFDLFIAPFSTRLVIAQALLLSTCCLFLGLGLLRNEGCPRPWAVFLFLLTGWELYAGLLRVHLESGTAPRDSVEAAGRLMMTGEVSRLGSLLLASLFLGSMGITWKGKDGAGSPTKNDGSMYLGAAVILLYVSSWMGSGLGGLGFGLFLGGGLMGLAPLVSAIVGIALPVVAVLLVRKRDRCLTDSGAGRRRVGSWTLQAIGIFLAVRPLLLILLGRLLLQGCTTRPVWSAVFGPL